MKLWGALGRGGRRLRQLIQPGAGRGLVELEGLGSAAALLRALDAAMPHGAELWVDFPGDEAVELFLAERSGRRLTRASRSSYLIPISGDNLVMLARLVEGQPPGRLGVHVGVDHDGHRLVRAYDLDLGTINVTLSPALSADTQRLFRRVAADSEIDVD